ncbi:MAG: cytochrome P450 [Nannocystaceae bacterium]|nr:cytochrome P450 [Nannocystaceae bacterium]
MRTSSHFDDAAELDHGTKQGNATSRAALPPGPPKRLFFGNVFEFLADPLTSIDQLRDKYGDTSLSRFGPIRFVFTHNPDDIHHVLVRNHRNYVKSRSYEGLRLVMGNGLVTSEGDFWRRQRRLSQPAFHRQRLVGLGETMAECVETTMATWLARCDGKTIDIDFHQEMMRLTLSIVGRTLFGIDLGHESNTLGPAVSVVLQHANEFAESIVRVPLWVPTPGNLRFQRAKKLLDATVHKIISARRESNRDEGDLLSMLMGITDESGEERMTDAQLRDEVMTLFLAGHETIATTMSWTFLLLTQHPDVLAKVRAEANEVLGDRPVTFADLPRLEYLGWVVNESMRIYPPVWILERQALADDMVGGYRIPKGTIVAVSPWGLHHSPKLWRNPERFEPERFSPERSEGRSKYAFLPFGGGPRVCIGNSFALMEAKVIVASLVRRFSVEIATDPPPTPEPRVTLRPRDGMRAKLTPL